MKHDLFCAGIAAIALSAADPALANDWNTVCVVVGNQRTSEWAIYDYNKDWRTPEAKLWSFNPKLDPVMQQPCLNDPDNRMCHELWLAPRMIMRATKFVPV